MSLVSFTSAVVHVRVLKAMVTDERPHKVKRFRRTFLETLIILSLEKRIKVKKILESCTPSSKQTRAL